MIPMPITVILADDHGLVRSGIKSLLEDVLEITVIDEASDGDEALQKVAEKQPDILIVDIKMPRLNGLDTIKQLPNYSSRTRALVLSMHNSEEYVLKSIECGAHGYLIKDASKGEFITAIKAVYRNEKFFSGSVSQILVEKYLENLPKQKEEEKSIDFELTRREKQILELIANGMSNKDIADLLEKSIRTIETHRFNLMKKLNVKNYSDLIDSIKAHKLINFPGENHTT